MFWTSRFCDPSSFSSQQSQENVTALELVVTGFSVGETISSSVASLFGASRARKAMSVRLVISDVRATISNYSKRGGIRGNPIQQ